MTEEFHVKQQIKLNSCWCDREGKKFTVLQTAILNDNIWIQYRNEQGREFSCYEESFISRFTENLNLN